MNVLRHAPLESIPRAPKDVKLLTLGSLRIIRQLYRNDVDGRGEYVKTFQELPRQGTRVTFLRYVLAPLSFNLTIQQPYGQWRVE